MSAREASFILFSILNLPGMPLPSENIVLTFYMQRFEREHMTDTQMDSQSTKWNTMKSQLWPEMNFTRLLNDFARISLHRVPATNHAEEFVRSFEADLQNPSSPQFSFYSTSNTNNPQAEFDRLARITPAYRAFVQQTLMMTCLAYGPATALLHYITPLEWTKCLQ